MQVFRSFVVRFQMLLMLVGVVVAGLGLTLAVLMQQTATQLEETAALQYAQTLAERNGDAAAQGLRQAFTTGADPGLGPAIVAASGRCRGQKNAAWAWRCWVRCWRRRRSSMAYGLAGSPMPSTMPMPLLPTPPTTTPRALRSLFCPATVPTAASPKMVLQGYEQAGDGDYYLQARGSRASTLLEPYSLRIPGPHADDDLAGRAPSCRTGSFWAWPAAT